jgi:hypothetical protein
MSHTERIRQLVALRNKIDAELEQIRARVAAEAEAQHRAREKALDAGVGLHRRKVAQCGTDSGYYRHRRRRHEPACEACLLAHRVAESVRAARKRAA